MKRILSILGLLCAVTASAQLSVQFDFASCTTLAEPVRALTLYPFYVNSINPGGLTVADYIQRYTGTNGSVTISNILPGTYYAVFSGITTQQTNWFTFPATNGLIIAEATNANGTPAYMLNTTIFLGSTVPAWSQTQSDLRYLRNNSTNVIIGNAIGLTNHTQNPNFDGKFFASDFGMVGDGKLLTDVSSLAGSAVVTSASANFKQSDVGKCVILYTNYTVAPNPGNGTAGTNKMGQLYATITFVNPGLNQATLSFPSAFSSVLATNRMWYGSDNTAAFQAMVNAAYTNNGTIELGRGVFMFSGPLQDTSVRNAMILLPNDNTSAPRTAEIDGQGSDFTSVDEVTGYGASTNGTILMIANNAIGATGSNACFIGGNNVSTWAAGQNATHNIILKRLSIISMPNPTMDILGLAKFGGYLIDSCAFGVDFPGTQLQAYPTLVPSITNTAAIRSPIAPANDFAKIYNSWIWGFGYGLIASDHQQCYANSILNCQCAVWVPGIGSVGGNSDMHWYGGHIMGSYEGIRMDGTAQMGLFSGLVFEGNVFDVGSFTGTIQHQNGSFSKGPDFNNGLTSLIYGPKGDVQWQSFNGISYTNQGPLVFVHGSNTIYGNPLGTFEAYDAASVASTLQLVGSPNQTFQGLSFYGAAFSGQTTPFGLGDWILGEGFYNASISNKQFELEDAVNNRVHPWIVLPGSPDQSLVMSPASVTVSNNFIVNSNVTVNGNITENSPGGWVYTNLGNGTLLRTNIVTGAQKTVGVSGNETNSGTETASLFTGSSAGLTNHTQAANFDGNFFSSDFGMIGDGKLLVDVGSTAGSGVVTSGSANFKASDVGKCVILYTNYTVSPMNAFPNNGTNKYGVLCTTIASFQSSSQVTLAANSAFTSGAATNRMWYGTDNTTPFTNMVNAAFTNNGTINISRGVFMFAGALQDINTRNAMVMLPNDNTTPPRTVQIIGKGSGVAQVNEFYSFPAPTNGTILLIAQNQTSAGSNACFIGGNHQSSWAQGGDANHNIILDRLTILQAPNPQFDALGLATFGGYIVRDCAIGVDFPGNQSLIYTNLIPVTTNTAAIRSPWPPANDYAKLYNTWIWGYGTGLITSDHQQVYGSSILDCQKGIWVPIGSDLHSYGLHLMNNNEAVAADGQSQPVIMSGTVFELNSYDVGLSTKGVIQHQSVTNSAIALLDPDFANNQRLYVFGPYMDVQYQPIASFPYGQVFQSRGPIYTINGSNDAFATPLVTLIASNSAATISTIMTAGTAEQTGVFTTWGRSSIDGFIPSDAVHDWMGGEGYYAGGNGGALSTTQWQLYGAVNNISPIVVQNNSPTLALNISGNQGINSSTNFNNSWINTTNGQFWTSNALTAANTMAYVTNNMTNGGFWVGFMTNTLQCVWMSNNVVNIKRIAP